MKKLRILQQNLKPSEAGAQTGAQHISAGCVMEKAATVRFKTSPELDPVENMCTLIKS